MTPVRVIFRKWDGSLHWHFDVTRLGEDEHGLWFGAPDGAPVRRGGEEPISGPAFALLIPRSAHYTVAWNTPKPDSPFPYEVYADICTPAEWDGDTVMMIDLDLDVVRGHDGRCEIRDEDEFALHRETFGYPADVVASARSAADRLLHDMTRGAEPFGEVGEGWRDQV